MTDKTDILINSAMIFLSVAVVIAGLEVALGVGLVTSEASFPKYQWCQGPHERGQFHPQYGVTEIPGQQYLEKRSTKAEWTKVTINDEGFRDTYNTGQRNIIVLGDSYTKGLLADDNATYPYLLDRWTPNVSFRNYGIGGYGTKTELLVYRNVADEYSHDVVILQYYMGNDMIDNVMNKSNRPLFVVENGSLVQIRPPMDTKKKVIDRGVAPGPIQSGPLAVIKGFLVENTNSYEYLAGRLGSVLAFFGLLDRSLPRPPKGEALDEQMQVTRLLLSALADETRQHDATLLIVSIPERSEVNPDNPNRYTHEDAEAYADKQRRMLRDVASAHPNVHYLGMKPALVNERQRGNRVYGVVDGHLNEYGYRVTARVIYRWLTEADVVTRHAGINFSEQYDTNIRTCP